MTADLSDGCGNGNGWLVHGMPVSRIAQQLASDVVEPAIPAETSRCCVVFISLLFIASIGPTSKSVLFSRQQSV